MKNSLLEIAYEAESFKSFGKEVVETLAKYLNDSYAAQNPTIRWNTPDKEYAFWNDFLWQGEFDELIPEVIHRTTHVHHPKYVGHQVAAPVPISAISAMVSALLNNGMAVYEMGMAPSAIERVVTDRLCQVLGYDHQSSGGFLTSGGTLANLTALLAARKNKVSYDVWTNGQQHQLGVMVCEEAHYCIDRAARIMGLGDSGILQVPANKGFAIRTELLEASYTSAKEKGIEVFAIVGSAPSTATGTHDDLKALAKFAQEKDIWFHVDAAHGGGAIFSKKYRHLLHGIELADSVTIDGHKMLLMPTITTALLFKDKRHAQLIFNQKADYLLNDTEEDQWYQSGKKTFECTKTMMSLHWMLLLKRYGGELFDEFVTRQYDLTQEFAHLIKTKPQFELATWPQSNIICFRWIDRAKTNEELNQINLQIRRHLIEEGEFYLVQTLIKGQVYLRTTLMNPFTTMGELHRLLQKITQLAEKIKQYSQ